MDNILDRFLNLEKLETINHSHSLEYSKAGCDCCHTHIAGGREVYTALTRFNWETGKEEKDLRKSEFTYEFCIDCFTLFDPPHEMKENNLGNIDSITYLTGQALQGLLAQGRIMDCNVLEESAVEIGARTHRLLIENKNKRAEEAFKKYRERILNE